MEGILDDLPEHPVNVINLRAKDKFTHTHAGKKENTHLVHVMVV